MTSINMTSINIGTTIARERRRINITQSAFAEHLGVSKAAVSKWELGQSLPDVALLPCIAAYFNLSLDELFDYQPQLTKDQIYEIYSDMLQRFSLDATKAYEYAEELIARYYSCWPFLVQMGVLYMNRSLADPDQAEVLMQRAQSLFVRVETYSDDIKAAQNARFVRAAALQACGDTDEAIELLEELRAALPFGVELMLASLYHMKGDEETCLQLYQELVYYGVLNTMSSITSQLQLCGEDVSRLTILLNAGEGVCEGFSLEQEDKGQAITFFGAAAVACANIGDEARAVSYLERFVDVLSEFDIVGESSRKKSIVFDRVSEEVLGSPPAEKAMGSQFEAMGFKNQLKLLVTDGDAWVAYANNPRITQLLDRLKTM